MGKSLTRQILLKKVPIEIYKDLILEKADTNKNIEDIVIERLKQWKQQRQTKQ